MSSTTETHCDDLFRYSLKGRGESLEFTSFELLGPLKGTELDSALAGYFVGRRLAEVSAKDLPPGCCTEEGQCRTHIIRHVLEVKELLEK